MAKGSTWQKKLMVKGKQRALTHKLGSFKPRSLSSTLDGDIDNKPKEREWITAKRIDYVPAKPIGGRRGCRLNHETRMRILEINEARLAMGLPAR